MKKLWPKVSYLSNNSTARECSAICRVNTYLTVFLLYNALSLLSVSVVVSSLYIHTYAHTLTHNSCSKFFQGISRLINRLVVWGSSEVQGSRLNPLTRRIISGRWVHTSPVAPHNPLLLTCGKKATLPLHIGY